MSRTKTTIETPRAIAAEWADRYFAALSAEIPGRDAVGGVDLILAASAIEDALRGGVKNRSSGDDISLRAGYLLGVEVGKRIAGGAR